MSRTKTAKRNRKQTTARPSVRTRPQPTSTPAPSGLPIRDRRPFITDTQIRAAYAAVLVGVTYTRITGWEPQDDGTVRYALPSGAGLTYDPNAKTPLTAWTPCAQRVRHSHPVATRQDLADAQIAAARCTTTHGNVSTDTETAVHAKVTPDFSVKAPGDIDPAATTANIPIARPLADVLARATGREDDTEQTDVTALRAQLADAPKEHPDHD
ncbi:hypothetical protein ACFQ6Q_00190 [Streptomyces sp. NPDC056437]|uniref:hypothetical protein n=1 Tax=Streptomyces sp. NPDC056437 TaxID=3345816 RepID=UPI00367D319F